MTVIDDWLQEGQDYQIPGSTVITQELTKDRTHRVKTKIEYVNHNTITKTSGLSLSDGVWSASAREGGMTIDSGDAEDGEKYRFSWLCPLLFYKQKLRLDFD